MKLFSNGKALQFAVFVSKSDPEIQTERILVSGGRTDHYLVGLLCGTKGKGRSPDTNTRPENRNRTQNKTKTKQTLS